MEQKFFEEVTVGERKYQIYRKTGRDALHLDVKVIDLMAELQGIRMTAGELGRRVISLYAKMTKEDFDSLVIDTIGGIVFVGETGEKTVKLDSDNLWDHFAGRVSDLYSLMMEAWRVYELTPFAQMRAGS